MFSTNLFQDEILEAVGPEAFELGLLMGTESDPTEEDQIQVYYFHHLMILEFVAAKYVATLSKVNTTNLFVYCVILGNVINGANALLLIGVLQMHPIIIFSMRLCMS